tara:strand:+ start:169 stop:2724 length:2556 start_codon:yes stop_codon:yes gene_type:complete
MSKNASFKGDISGTIENQVNDWDTQSIGGSKTFTNAITSSADVMLSGSGKVSASFFFGDGSNLSNVGGSAAGSNTQVQFNDSNAFGASPNFTFGFSAQAVVNKLSVNGQISASFGVTGSQVHAVSFHGSGAGLTNLTSSAIVGIISGSQIGLGPGLEVSSDAIQINLSSSTSGLSIDTDGLQVDVATLGTDSGFDVNKKIIVQESSNHPKQMTLNTIQSGLTIQGSQLAGQMPTGRLPDTISVVNVTASSVMSASAFHGNGSALIGVTSTPTPAGSNSQVQFNDDGAIAADAQLFFLTGSNTLATTILSASSFVSASEYGGVAGTLIDSAGNFAGNNASFNQITASHEISSSHDIFGLNFRGNGSTLNNVPLVSSNAASVVFIGNSSNQTITTNSGFTFNGTNVLNSGGGFHGTTISSSANTSIGGNLVIGSSATTLSADELGVLDGVTAGTAAASKAMVLDSDADITGFRQLKSATDNGSSLEITGAVGVLQLTLEGVQYKNNTNTSTARFLPTGIISASADIQVGGHITGSGDLVFAGSTSKIHFDPAGSSATNGPSISTTNLTSLMIDGDNILNMQGDTNIRLRVGGGSSATHDMRVDITETHLSSSIDLSASAIHFADSPSGVITSGGNTFLDNNGNIFTGNITSQGNISASINISASAFYGDGSNLENVSATPQFRFHYLDCRPQQIDTSANNARFFNIQAGGRANRADQNTRWVAPASGSIARVVFASSLSTISDGSATHKIADSDTPIFFVSKNNSTIGNADSRMITMTGSSANMKKIDYVTDNGTISLNRVIFDVANTQPAITGSNSFDAGDILNFQLINSTIISNPIVSIVFKLEEEGVTYP